MSDTVHSAPVVLLSPAQLYNTKKKRIDWVDVNIGGKVVSYETTPIRNDG